MRGWLPIGIGIGLMGAAVLSGLLEAYLGRVAGTVPETLGGAATGILAVAIVACWIRAQEAAEVDPVRALASQEAPGSWRMAVSWAPILLRLSPERRSRRTGAVMEPLTTCTDRRRAGSRGGASPRVIVGVTILMPRKGSSPRRSASALMIQSARPQTASSSTWSSFGSRRARVDSVTSTRQASRRSNPGIRSRSPAVTYRSNSGRDTTLT